MGFPFTHRDRVTPPFLAVTHYTIHRRYAHFLAQVQAVSIASPGTLRTFEIPNQRSVSAMGSKDKRIKYYDLNRISRALGCL